MEKYIDFYGKKMHGRIYDDYGVDTQGVIKYINTNDNEYIIGIKYRVMPEDLFNYLLYTAILLFIINIIVICLFARSTASDIKQVALKLNEIVETKNISLDDKLPVTSNDEIGDLVIAFNKIQDLTKKNIREIKDNEQSLMEKERLASLGQLIGGIAHNLKTPIMSVSGAIEGLTDLIGEYIASISNPTVTNEDHKEIAKDMLEWVAKIKTHLEYMSDIITAVKGQAVQLSASDLESFTVYDLAKRVDILIKHEIKKALLNLNIDIKTNPALLLYGDINSLVQVLNNLITNAIHAYNSKPNQVIDFEILDEFGFVKFIIRDYGCGIPKNVQEKLFKEMITTKGKAGTGLGLYMSYSTIKGKFNGNMTFESEEGKGTSFIITIPLKPPTESN